MAEMDVYEILTRLPHRFPMLMIDRVLECEPGKRIVALKNVSVNEPFFQGHFPGVPIMPGVLILEAMAQAAGVLAFSTQGQQADGRTLYFGSTRSSAPLILRAGSWTPAPEAVARCPARASALLSARDALTTPKPVPVL